MKFFELIETIRNMNSRNKPAELTKAIHEKNNEGALALIQNKTLSAKLYRAGFFVMNGGESLLEKGWGGVDSPLQRAAADGNMPVLHALLKAGAKVDSKNYLGWTPLHDALYRDQTEAAIALINAGADVNALFRNINAGTGDKTSYYPLHIALRRKLGLPMVKFLVEKGAEVNVAEYYNSILCEAVTHTDDNHLEVIEFLLQQGADPNKTGMSHNYSRGLHITNSPLYFALDWGKEQIARTLLVHGANIYLETERSYFDRNGYFADEHRYQLPQNLITMAIEICRKNGIAVPVEPVPLAVREQRLLHAFRVGGKQNKNETNTHAVSIHRTVSESAARLQKSYTITKPSQVYLQVLTDCLSIPENLTAIQNLILHAAKGVNVPPRHNEITNAMNDLIKKVSKSTFVDDGLDYGSKVKLSVLLYLILEAISKLDVSVQRDGLLKLCEHMYFAQIEVICESGIFNTLVYSQQSILPEVQVLIQTKADASNSCSNRLIDFVAKIYHAQAPFDDVDAFETAVKVSATPEECAKIMREIFAEYYLIFNLKSPEVAITLSGKALDRLCIDFLGLELKNIFDTVEYANIYRNMSMSAQSHSVINMQLLAS